MTHQQALVVKYADIKLLYTILRTSGKPAAESLRLAKARKEIAEAVLVPGSFLNHFNKYHNL